jgi:N-acetylneuraminic acid mutarotase
VQADLTSAWTGRQLLVYGLGGIAADGNALNAVQVAAAYDPAARTWRKLPAPPGAPNVVGRASAVWTGREMLVTSAFGTLAFDPRTDRWRRLRRGHGGLVVWTGRELIGWGGGCCGDAFSDGAAYDPAANRWRTLPRSPLAGSQGPLGAWTGRELIVLVGGLDPDGKPWPARLARAAAYNPATNKWRRIAPLPAPRGGASAVWDGRELLVVGGAPGARKLATVGFAYDPATNRWRRLAPMESGRVGAAAVWTGKRLLLWGGTTRAGSLVVPRHGLAYDPRTNRWSPLPQAPLRGRLDPTAAWTGRAFVVWGGSGRSGHRGYADGAAFTPSVR